MTRTLFFPDTTVVSNFALIDKMDLLREMVNGNGSWCATVASECSVGASKPGLSAMNEAASIFGEPLFPSPSEHVDIQVLQEKMMQPGDVATSHLGEAETIVIITGRQIAAAFVTDDADARRQAKLHGVPVYSTWHILKLAVATRRMTLEEFQVVYHLLVNGGRGHPPCARNVDAVVDWLSSDA